MSAEVPNPMFEPEFPGLAIESLAFLHNLSEEMNRNVAGPELAMRDAGSQVPDLEQRFAHLDGILSEIIEENEDDFTDEALQADEDEIALFGIQAAGNREVDSISEFSVDDFEGIEGIAELDDELDKGVTYPYAEQTLEADEELLAAMSQDFRNNPDILPDKIWAALTPEQQAKAVERLRKQREQDGDPDEQAGADSEE